MPTFWRKPSTPTDDPLRAVVTSSADNTDTIVASAMRVNAVTMRASRALSDSEWQREAWAFYDTVPEFRYVCDWKSQAASRVRLFITTVDDNGTPEDNPSEPVPFGPTFMGGPVIQAQLLAAMVLHLEIVGLCFLIGQIVDDGERWDVYSLEDLQDDGQGNVAVDMGAGVFIPLDPLNSIIIKIWRAHPRKHAEANAPARAARAPLREIIRSDQTIAAQLDSRLTGAGILLLPKELSFTVAGADQDDGPGDDAGADPFMSTLTNSMMTAIGDPNSVEAVVPILVRGPGEQLDKVRLLTLSTPVSESIGQTRDGAVGRLARGLDIAAEVLLGMGNTNHLSGWQIEESNAKVHLANPVELICAALTEQYLWPAARGLGITGYRRFVIWYTLSELVQRPDRAADAQQVYDRGELSGKSLRRENGFTENDAPTPAERHRHDLLEVAGKVPVAAPAVVSELLRQMGVKLTNLAAPTPALPQPGNPANLATPSGPGSQGRGVGVSAPQESRPLPAPTTVQASAATITAVHASPVLAAAEALTLRALETAGKRLVGRARHKLGDLAPWEYHTAPGLACTPTSASRLLDGAWAACPSVAASAHIDTVALTAVLNTYATELLCTGQPHTPELLRKMLAGTDLL